MTQNKIGLGDLVTTPGTGQRLYVVTDIDPTGAYLIQGNAKDSGFWVHPNSLTVVKKATYPAPAA